MVEGSPRRQAAPVSSSSKAGSVGKVEFPKLVSHNRFVELIKGAALLLCAYLRSRFGRCTGTTFVDSTALAVCHNRRISRHRVFKGFAARGKSSMGWFYGFKLHVIVNEQGELLAVHLTPGNTEN